MAVTQNTYTGNGSTVLFSFTFPYLETTDIKVSVNGTITTAYTLANATTVQFNTAPANGAAIRIFRQTDDAALAATFYPGSAIRSQDLNENFTQNLYVTQEINSYAIQDLGSVTLTGNYTFTNPVTGPTPVAAGDYATKGYVDSIATNAGNVTSGNKGDIVVSANLATWSLDDSTVTNSKLAPSAVTSDKIADGTILDADISATAAIAGSKIQAASTTNAGAVQLNGTTSSTSTTQAATANSVKTAWDLASAALPKAGGTMTGDVTLNAQSDLRFADGDSSNWVAVQAPATVASNVTWTLPAADGTAAQMLSTNGSGTLSWASVSEQCKAWVNFNAATAVIRASYNVSSITYNSTGDHTVNFTTAMPDANYSVVSSVSRSTPNSVDTGVGLHTVTSGSFGLYVEDLGGTPRNRDIVTAAVFR